MKNRRVDIKKILADPQQCRKLMVQSIIASQAREGIVTTQEQAEAAYDKVQKEKPNAFTRGVAWDKKKKK